MRSLRLPSLLMLLVLLPSLLGARGCEEPAPVARLPPSAPFRFEDYGNPATGEVLVGRAQSLAGHEAHRERLFSLALQGHPTASLYWRRLEEVAAQLGSTTADEANGADCVALQAVVECGLDANIVHTYIPGPQAGGLRLRQVVLESFLARRAQLRPEFEAKSHVARGLFGLAGSVVLVKGAKAASAAAEAEAGASSKAEAEAQAAARAAAARAEAEAAARETVTRTQGGAPVRTTVAKAEAGAAARAGAVEAQAGTQRLLSAESLGLHGTLAPEVVQALEARLLSLEAEMPALARQPASLDLLAAFRPSLEAPPSGVAASTPLWQDYVSYWELRFRDMQAAQQAGRVAPKPPMYWDAYSQMRTLFREGLIFQGEAATFLRSELSLPDGQRSLSRGIRSGRVDENMGVRPTSGDTTYFVDLSLLDEASLAKGMTPRIESFSCKKHSFLGWEEKALENQVRADAQAALARYGGEIQVRRPGHPLFGRTVRVSKVHLVYDAKGATAQQIQYILKYAKGLGVEVHFL